MKNNNNFDLTAAFDGIGIDITGKKTREATIAALEAIKAENDTARRWTLIRDLAIALSCSVATIVAWIWPNKNAINKQIRKYDEGEFLWQSEFYTNTQMMNMGLYQAYADKCKEIAEKIKKIEEENNIAVDADGKYKTPEAKTTAINNLKAELEKIEKERDAIRRNPDYKKDDNKKKKEKKEKKGE